MNNPEHNTTTTHRHEHGTTASYISGFLLSLLFTFIPYYLVVKHKVSGNALLATILSFAVLQMVVQLVFFLHLGREKKPRWQLWFLIGTVIGILTVVGGSLWIMHHLYYNMTPATPAGTAKKLIEDEGIHQMGGEKTGACQGVRTTHKVTLKNGTISPRRINAQMCDKLTFINEDDKPRYIMFGSFEQPEAYAGEDMLTVRKGRPETIVLNELGTHKFHDHTNSKIVGEFSVTPPVTEN